jgi:hypothetical protein
VAEVGCGERACDHSGRDVKFDAAAEFDQHNHQHRAEAETADQRVLAVC